MLSVHHFSRKSTQCGTVIQCSIAVTAPLFTKFHTMGHSTFNAVLLSLHHFSQNSTQCGTVQSVYYCSHCTTFHETQYCSNSLCEKLLKRILPISVKVRLGTPRQKIIYGLKESMITTGRLSRKWREVDNAACVAVSLCVSPSVYVCHRQFMCVAVSLCVSPSVNVCRRQFMCVAVS